MTIDVAIQNVLVLLQGRLNKRPNINFTLHNGTPEEIESETALRENADLCLTHILKPLLVQYYNANGFARQLLNHWEEMYRDNRVILAVLRDDVTEKSMNPGTIIRNTKPSIYTPPSHTFEELTAMIASQSRRMSDQTMDTNRLKAQSTYDGHAVMQEVSTRRSIDTRLSYAVGHLIEHFPQRPKPWKDYKAHDLFRIWRAEIENNADKLVELEKSEIGAPILYKKAEKEAEAIFNTLKALGKRLQDRVNKLEMKYVKSECEFDRVLTQTGSRAYTVSLPSASNIYGSIDAQVRLSASKVHKSRISYEEVPKAGLTVSITYKINDQRSIYDNLEIECTKPSNMNFVQWMVLTAYAGHSKFQTADLLYKRLGRKCSWEGGKPTFTGFGQIGDKMDIEIASQDNIEGTEVTITYTVEYECDPNVKNKKQESPAKKKNPKAPDDEIYRYVNSIPSKNTKYSGEFEYSSGGILVPKKQLLLPEQIQKIKKIITQDYKK